MYLTAAPINVRVPITIGGSNLLMYPSCKIWGDKNPPIRATDDAKPIEVPLKWVGNNSAVKLKTAPNDAELQIVPRNTKKYNYLAKQNAALIQELWRFWASK